MYSFFWRGTALAAAAVTLAFAATAADEPKTEKKQKPPSVCVGLDINACGAKSECYWRKQVTTKAGKVRRAHCRKRPFQQVAKKTA
ncbi:hypothetical protein [Hyphomicrobium sp.]|uniref:hypothetical protein n=1 Tax=Hyphomicrobium sp. TaxID=82 RepID=UPI0025BE3D5F|nr:hypothetical protein [Hyphomicrobium sp.]